MGSFFKPLRRKIGVLTLAVACVVMVVWVRSIRELDQFTFRQVLNLPDGKLEWGISTYDGWLSLATFTEHSPTTIFVERVVGAPLWLATAVLTALSAWLLLSKPRVAKPPAIVQE